MSKDEIEVKDEEDSVFTGFAKSLVAIEEPLPEKANLESVLEMLGRIEHELVVYRRERLLKSYLVAALIILPIIGLGYLIPSFVK